MKIIHLENPVEILDWEKEIGTELTATESYESGKRRWKISLINKIFTDETLAKAYDEHHETSYSIDSALESLCKSLGGSYIFLNGKCTPIPKLIHTKLLGT